MAAPDVPDVKKVKDVPEMKDAKNTAAAEQVEIANLNRLLERLDGSGVAQYVRLMQCTPRVLWLNFLSGIARGLGFTVGTAIVIAIAYKIISGIIRMNIPYLTELLQHFVEIIQGGAVN